MSQRGAKAKGPGPSLTEYKAIAAEWEKAKKAKEAADAEAASQGLPTDRERANALQKKREQLNKLRQSRYEKRWLWTVAFWIWMLAIHAIGIWLFTTGFLLTRLVLHDKSTCDAPPIDGTKGLFNPDKGCWHPKTFDRAVVILIDALRYDFTVPHAVDSPHAYHNAFPVLHEIAAKSPQNAFLRPFIADPPTATLQRLKGLTTGTLPTFIDLGSSFKGDAIDEDNLLMQLKNNGKRVAQIGDDTWWSLFPGYFEPNISRAYDSFDVWDLHTVDNGVIDHILPLLEPKGKNQWDLLIGHCLGVDHAGHRYGPDHPAMTSKLQQMDDFIRKAVSKIDDDTLLVVMGDHGMDSKGDHGGESDDEVEAALWMYAKRPIFGRTLPEHAMPPPNAKIRPANQIDFVPTLSLLLGIPVPFNNLGTPIEEAFVGPRGNDWANLAAVSRVTAAGIERYQKLYFETRGITPGAEKGSPAALWTAATERSLSGRSLYDALSAYQERNLEVCKSLWARFDVPRMGMGVFVTAIGLLVLVMYSSRTADDEYVVLNNPELDYAEKQLEQIAASEDDQEEPEHPDQFFHRNLLRWATDVRVILAIAALTAAAVFRGQPLDRLATVVATIMIARTGTALHQYGKTLRNLLPNTFWGWLAVIFTVSHSIGFASNSYTIWEDTILLFFITTFGVAALVSSFRIESSRVDRYMGIYHSVVFIVLGRVASYSKLCREEQMPYCQTTYYNSSSSSTSALWQLTLPFLAFLGLPALVKSFLVPTRSYEGLAPTWIGYVFRFSLLLSALYWLVDAANNGRWLAAYVSELVLKTAGVYIAQFTLAITVVAGTTAFAWAPPSVAIVPSRGRVTILGYANALGARYLLLPISVLGTCLLLTKPMGAGALSLMTWQLLALVELVDLLGLKAAPIGPVMLAVLGNFYFFKTGHQANLASIQWDTAFVPLFTIRYPWAPLAVAVNTFAAQILAVAALPLVALWKVGPRQRGALEAVARALGAFVAYYAVEALATMACAGWLRRHLMLFRVFSPRFMMAALLLLLLDALGILVTLTGVRSNSLAVGDVFGWAE
ncbi:Alkaline phosphatase-like, alpha/beta/alpha [Cordyceps fumosorosea ARSEF 2679]|uniref:Alkaline phosphatase-like, alpha/beta/alpha n=1 Tax=Cordyceps fumosorosea (strain ARSEF 2679) TaxID=1081104 RepID=A0A162MVR9_CORFA|nr:Alkaline phosphatase-like, alpha/beta/alpha [Cordyceps fumosorosea ARSEF 2679]OAA71329.1 Alkaline phosphatase-like, alpha/beta/alpha [Cordyceps fumosorosea ARSEF 2679]